MKINTADSKHRNIKHHTKATQEDVSGRTFKNCTTLLSNQDRKIWKVFIFT